MNRFMGAIKKGIVGVQNAYNQEKKNAEERAKRKMEAAKTKYEKERIKAELEREKLKLQREMYEAKAAVQREKLAVARAKREAGIVSFGERAGKFMSKSLKSFQQLQQSLDKPPKKRRKGR